MSNVVALIVALTLASSPLRSGATRAMGQDIRPIGEIQGSVGDGVNALDHQSPYAPGGSHASETPTVQGVIYERTLARSFNFTTGQVSLQHGLYIQNTAATADGDPNTSDGIFVFIGRSETLLREDGTTYTPEVGDEVVLRGLVVEFDKQTQLSNPTVLSVVRSGVDLDAELPAFDANPPFDPATGRTDPAEVSRYWERREGMRAKVSPGSIVSGPAFVSRGQIDGEIGLIHPDHPIAQRSDPFARRAFRDPHPLDNVPGELFDDTNAYRIRLGSRGIKATTASDTATVAPTARTFDVVSAPAIGAAAQFRDKYLIHVVEQPALTAGPDPSLNAPPQPPDRTREYSVATFNVENLYDFRDDPTDDCDFAGNVGCPGAEPPFDYVSASDAAYWAHLDELADQILLDLHSPDLLLIQEAEDQDICVVAADGVSLSCDTTNAPTPESSRDHKPDTLQELALLIASKGGPTYDAASDPAGADSRGIVAAFLYRTDRVQLLPVPSDDPVLSDHPSVVYAGDPVPSNTRTANPKALNALIPSDVTVDEAAEIPTIHARGPQVGLFRISQGIDAAAAIDLYAISNHFSSGPAEHIRRRREQATYTAALVAALQVADPQVPVVVGGDFNTYPRPDDPVLPPSDQLKALYDQGLYSLYDRLVAEVPTAAYSYVFDHQAQALDQIFVTDPLLAALETIRVAHVNSDWPLDVPDDGPRRSSDHDPSVARLRFGP